MCYERYYTCYGFNYWFKSCNCYVAYSKKLGVLRRYKFVEMRYSEF